MKYNEVNEKIDSSLPFILCGFSKGCVVLNQICSELHFIDINDMNLTEFRNRISCIVWLDGGHAGESNFFHTNPNVVQNIKNLNCKCFIYLTPYQYQSRKKKLKLEYEKFLELLKEQNIDTITKVYLEDANPYDIEAHFQILKLFEIN